MTEDLPLPPEVRAIQADVLRPLVFGWPCDGEQGTCDEPAMCGGRTGCCHATALLCARHLKGLFSEFAGARLAGQSMLCPKCGKEYAHPVHPSDIFDVSVHLTITDTNLGGAQ